MSRRTDEGLVLALDQGTHASRAVLFDGAGEAVFEARRQVALRRGHAGCVEQDADELLDSVRAVLHAARDFAVHRRRPIGACGLATQRSTVVAWDQARGAPLAPALSWQDTRHGPWLARFARHARRIRQRTGLRLSPHYGASKLRWLLDEVPAVRQAQAADRLALGPLASFLLQQLVVGRPFLTDHTNAARTLLWNLRTRDWDPELLALFGVDAALLPACRANLADYGEIDGTGIALTALSGDQSAALYAWGEPAAGVVHVNLGTGGFVLAPTGARLKRHPGLLAGLAQSAPASAEYLLEGTVNGAGAAFTWAADRWGIAAPEQCLHPWPDAVTSPPLFLNGVGGLGSPWWRTDVVPGFLGSPGFDPRRQPEAAATAIAESIVFLVQRNLDCLAEAGLAPVALRASGGLAAIDALCQRLADLSGCEVQRPAQIEATARGIAWLAAGRPAGWGRDVPDRFAPRSRPALHERYTRFIEQLDRLDAV